MYQRVYELSCGSGNSCGIYARKRVITYFINLFT